MAPKFHLAKPRYPIIILMIGYVFIALYLGIFLQYDFFRSDVLSYWHDSLDWQTPFHPFHVPGYPLAIAALRWITFGMFSPIFLMMMINLVTFLVSIFLIYRIIQAGANEEYAVIGAFLFGLWPFIGLTYTVMPLADIPSISLFLAGLYSLQRNRRISASVFLGLSMVTHKAMWPFVGLLVIADLLYYKEYLSNQKILFIVTTFLPIGILWLFGSMYHHSFTWIFSSNIEVEVAPLGSSFLLDGLLGTLTEGGIKGGVKGIIIMSFSLLSSLLLYMSIRIKDKHFHYGITISLTVFVLFITLNQYEIWAAVRFSRLLVIPLTLCASSRFRIKKSWFGLPAIIVLLFLFLSQLGYSWYVAQIYFG